MCKNLCICLLYLSILHNYCYGIQFAVDEDIEIAQFRVEFPEMGCFPTQENGPKQEISTSSGIIQPKYSNSCSFNNSYMVNCTLSGISAITSAIIAPLISNITLLDNNTFAVWDVSKNTPIVNISLAYVDGVDIVYTDIDKCGGLVNIYIDRASIIGGQSYDPGYYCTVPEPWTLIYIAFSFVVIRGVHRFARNRKSF
jgi:hypothetical protein